MRYSGRSDVKEGGSFEPIPAGVYIVEIVEVTDQKTKDGNDMTKVKFAVMSGAHKDRLLWDNILFIWDAANPKVTIMGRTKHFLHMIGEVYEPKIETESGDWVSKCLRVKVGIGEYTDKNGVQRRKNTVDAHLPLDPDDEPGTAPGEIPPDDNPFA